MLIDFSLEAVKITKQHVSTYAGRILSNRYRRWLRERKKNEEKNLPCFVCRTSPADAQFKQKSAARKDGLKIQLEGKVIGTSF